ncbi:MAG: RNA polymerase factor sigma-54 [Alphaproteobacteria bacterium]|nr:RNA polymerase factor sigma-54 [Alphaproteobacteria bacterium]
MRLSQKLQQKQTTSLVVTPQLRQAIHLLSLSNLELVAHLQQTVLDNPLLELEGYDKTSEDVPIKSEEGDWESPASDVHENLWSADSTSDRWAGGTPVTEASLDPFATIEAPPLTLQEHLLLQMQNMFEMHSQQVVALHLLADLDEAGYLTTDFESLSKSLGCTEVEIEEVLRHLQTCDPAGIFARNLQECLTAQLKERHLWTPIFERLMAHLSLFGEGKIDILLKKAALSKEELIDALQVIRSLDPKPGLAYAKKDNPPILPDLFVTWHGEDQRWDVRFNEATLPKVLIDTGYYARVWELGKKEIQVYLKEQLSSAQWLVKALDQRAQNVLKVATMLVATQQDFLKHGLSHLQPLTLKDVALELGLHESTVSRVVNHKYLQTPRGVFEMKVFFSNAVMGMADDAQHSAVSVRHLLSELIQEENPEDPYSDDQLVQKMAEKGVDVARRTISKYRKLLKIPSSYERKRTHEQASLAKVAS